MWLCTYIKSRACYKRSACHLDDFRHAKKIFRRARAKSGRAEKIFRERKKRGDADSPRPYANHPRPIFRSSDRDPAQVFFIRALLAAHYAASAPVKRYPGTRNPAGLELSFSVHEWHEQGPCRLRETKAINRLRRVAGTTTSHGGNGFCAKYFQDLPKNRWPRHRSGQASADLIHAFSTFSSCAGEP